MQHTTTHNKRQPRDHEKTFRLVRARVISFQGEDRMERETGLSEHNGAGNGKGSTDGGKSATTEEILKEVLVELKAIRKTLDTIQRPKKKSIFDSTGTSLRAPRGIL